MATKEVTENTPNIQNDDEQNQRSYRREIQLSIDGDNLVVHPQGGTILGLTLDGVTVIGPARLGGLTDRLSSSTTGGSFPMSPPGKWWDRPGMHAQADIIAARHGYARLVPMRIARQNESSCELKATPQRVARSIHGETSVALSRSITLAPAHSVEIINQVANTNEGAVQFLGVGEHPYFNADMSKACIAVPDTLGGHTFVSIQALLEEAGIIDRQLPSEYFIRDGSAATVLFMPNGPEGHVIRIRNALTAGISPEFHIYVDPKKGAVCVEPIGGVPRTPDDIRMLAPHESVTQNIQMTVFAELGLAK